MKISMSVFVAFLLSIAVMAQQDTSKQSGQATQDRTQSNQNTSQSMSSNAGNQNQSMSGKVSDKGKTFTSDKGQSYKVDNPDALTNYDNQQVGVIVQLNPDTGDIRVIHVAQQ